MADTRDFSQFVHAVKPDKQIDEFKPERTVVTASYTHRDKTTEFDADGYPLANSDDLTFARSIITQKKARFFIRQSAQGGFYDPLDLYSNPVSTKQQFIKDGSIDFREVGKQAFEYYIKFLKTSKKQWLARADKEMI